MKSNKLKFVGTSLCFFENKKYVSYINLHDKINPNIKAIYHFYDNIFIIKSGNEHYFVTVDTKTKIFHLQFGYKLPNDLVIIDGKRNYTQGVEIVEVNSENKVYYLCGYYEGEFGLIEIKRNGYTFRTLPFQPEELNSLYVNGNKFVCFYDDWKKMLVYDGKNLFDYENKAGVETRLGKKDLKNINEKWVEDYVQGKKDFLILQSNDFSQAFVFNEGQIFELSYNDVDLSYFLKNVLGTDKTLEYFDCVIKKDFCSFYAIVRKTGTTDIKAYKIELPEIDPFSINIFEKYFPEDAKQELFFKTVKELKEYVLFKAKQINSAFLHSRDSILLLTQNKVYNNCVKIYETDFDVSADKFYLTIDNNKLTLLQRSNGNVKEIQSFKVDKDKLTIKNETCYFVKDKSTVYFFDRFSAKPLFRKLDLKNLGFDFSTQALRFFDICRVKDLNFIQAISEINGIYYLYYVVSWKNLTNILHSWKMRVINDKDYSVYIVEVPLNQYVFFDSATTNLFLIHEGQFSKVGVLNKDFFETFKKLLLSPVFLNGYFLDTLDIQCEVKIIHAEMHPASWKEFHKGMRQLNVFSTITQAFKRQTKESDSPRLKI